MTDFTPSLLHSAAMKNNCDYLEQIQLTEEMLTTTFLGNTPLLWGVASSSISFVLKLLDDPFAAHINISSTEHHKNTPLILSLAKGWTHKPTKKDIYSQKDVAIKLLSKGANVNAVDIYGRTALHYACIHRNIEAIKTLIDAGASWDIKDKNGKKPLDLCVLDFDSATNILQAATGGSIGYTCTLDKMNFNSNDEFYSSLSKLLSENDAHDYKKLLQQACDWNQKIHDILAPLYAHAKKIYNQYRDVGNFEQYIRTADHNFEHAFGFGDPKAGRKIKALLKLYYDLNNTASADIDFSQNRLVISDKKTNIERLIMEGLKNPDIRAERHLITRIGMAVLNTISIISAGLPLLINYFKTGNAFFSHQTSSEKILDAIKDKINDQDSHQL